ncbi:receptor-interacting serine/threonine-protein kinase 2-like [Gracilinanus agilis]|uniref:receptor-interacting serine/threonine-protein kinase 2-like n=1 Tax=Gracilinanus agilis TaxID=191870 RepID=UPI001CFED25D|nr:receptor-interacting serine/threonine-protein kinase 2-like [Gracilinanus agilis]XP_044516501.1 receptor-interacting serine/threonine-protein kinase 2-like [Gracilinanus agilis]
MTSLQGSRRGPGHGSPGLGPPAERTPLKSTGTGPGHLLQIQAALTSHREFILRRVTEGRLNAALDSLRSCGALSRASYEAICSAPTRTARVRALLDTCISLGEEATRVALAVLLAPPQQRLRGWVTPRYLGPSRQGH